MASLPSRPKSQLRFNPESSPGGPPANPQSWLESLPDELLLHIIGRVDHGDICSFGYCCPRIREVARGAVENHQRRRQYSTLRCGMTGDRTQPSSHPIHILRDIILDGDIAVYPTKLILGPIYPGKNIVESYVKPTLHSHKGKDGRYVSKISILFVFIVLESIKRDTSIRNSRIISHFFFSNIFRISDRSSSATRA